MAPTLRQLVANIRNALGNETARQKFLIAAADMGYKRMDDYRRFEDYYEGVHRLRLTERERRFLEASGFRYAENFCETIVDTEVGRLAVTGFDSDKAELADFAKQLWAANHLNASQLQVHDGTVKLGDYFVIVEPPEDPEELPEVCPNHPGQVKAVYDSGEMVYAVKVWNTTKFSASNPNGAKVRRMNIYWPDRIEKWFATDSQTELWAPYREVEEDEGNSAEWTMDGHPEGEPIGIPVIHFANKPRVGTPSTEIMDHYGRSELRGVIPQQDALNKSLLDFFWVMDAQGWPQQWGTGVTSEGLTRHPGSLWTTEKENARFGQLAPAAPPIEAIESQITRMASRSSTPLHLMLAGGVLPSGETLKTSESGLVRKLRRFQTVNGDKWGDVVSMSARVDAAFGKRDGAFTSSSIPDGTLNIRWERAESRQELDEANTAVLWAGVGVSRDTILSRLGFDPAEEEKKRSAEEPLVVASDLLGKAQQMQESEQPPAGTGGDQPKKDQPGRNAARTR